MSGAWSGLFGSAPPPVGVEIAAGRVTAVSLGGQRGAWTITAHATERLADGVIVPALNAPNVHDRAAAAAAVRSVLERIGGRPRRVALVIPDTAAKVSILRFEQVPERSEDLDQLVHWQVRKAAPFKPEDAQISWVAGAPLTDGGREFIVTLARRDVVQSYEAVCADAGATAGIVDLSTFNLINTLLAPGTPPPGDVLLVHATAEYSTLAILRGGHLIFFRTRPHEAEGDLADLVHQTAMYHEDRLGGGGFARAWLFGYGAGGDGGEYARRSIESRLGTRVDLLDFRSAATLRDRIGAGPELLETLAPAIGVLLRERLTT